MAIIIRFYVHVRYKFDFKILCTVILWSWIKQYLSHVFPNLKIFRVRNSVDTNVFNCQSEKKKQICFIPTKNPDEFVQLFNILKQRKVLRGWEIVPIENKSQKETADILCDSLVFINLVYQEGFGLPAAEAMASGCTVIGYHGMGGEEYFKSEFCFPVATGKIIEVARTVEHVLELYENNPQHLRNKAIKSAEFIHKNYSITIQKEDVLEFWNTILKD